MTETNSASGIMDEYFWKKMLLRFSPAQRYRVSPFKNFQKSELVNGKS